MNGIGFSLSYPLVHHIRGVGRVGIQTLQARERPDHYATPVIAVDSAPRNAPPADLITFAVCLPGNVAAVTRPIVTSPTATCCKNDTSIFLRILVPCLDSRQ